MRNESMRKYSLATVFVVILSLFLAGNARPVAAATESESDTLFCDHVLFTGNTGITGSQPPTVEGLIFVGTDNHPPEFVGSIPVNPDGSFSGSVAFSIPAGTPIVYGVFGPHSAVVPSSCSGNVSFFNPGDGRVDPQPGDRIAVYCNKGSAPSIGVYGIDEQGQGIYLTQIPLATITKAGAGGLTVKAWQDGSVFIGTSGDTFWILWNGPFNAFSNAKFGKIVTCTFA